MLKNILRFLVACASFVSLLFITTSAISSTPVTTAERQLQPLMANLNVVSPSLRLASNTDTLVDHIGCSCAACTQSLRPSTEA
jgi:hypothetical protein